jgi:hypothetical protein
MMECPIEIDKVVGLNPDATGLVDTIVVYGTSLCKYITFELKVGSPRPRAETEVNPDGSFKAVFEDVKLQCDDHYKFVAYCKDDCELIDDVFYVECEKKIGNRPLYTSYFDCDKWNCITETMNIQDTREKFLITIYQRPGMIVKQEILPVKAHETIRYELNRYAKGQGHVTVRPLKDGKEFPSMLLATEEIAGRKITQIEGFIRVP